MKKILNKMVGFEGMRSIEKLWLYDILITAFRRGLVGGSLLMLLNGTNIMLLIANATPIYFICNILSKKLKDRISKCSDIFKLNLQIELISSVIFIITLILTVTVDIRFIIINIIIEYATGPLQNSASSYKDETAKRLVFLDAQSYQEFNVKVGHFSSMVSLTGYGLNLGALGLSKLITGLTIPYICKGLMILGCILTAWDCYISIKEYYALKELENIESEPVIQ